MNKVLVLCFVLLAPVLSAQHLKVTLFFSPTCPICIQYTPKLSAIDSFCRLNNIDFTVVLPRSFSAHDGAAFNQKFNTNIEFYFDKRNREVRKLKAEITPQVFVVDQLKKKTEYSGAIDDWYTSVGARKLSITNDFLFDALTELIDGREVSVPKTVAVGCLIN